jgi:uncharacterized protein DUF4365
MHVPVTHHTDRTGINAIAEKIHRDLGWIFREQHQDFGVDAQVEIVENLAATGKLLGLQIKSGTSYFEERDHNFITYRGDPAHLEYWLNHKLPILVVLYDPTTDVAYWESITEQNTTKTAKGWKLLIPVSQRIESKARRALEAVAEGPSYFQRLIELQFAKPWMLLLKNGTRLVVEAEEWINKLSGRGDIKLIAVDEDGEETVLQDWGWAIFYPGMGYENALPRFFPWANLSVDGDFYYEHDHDRYGAECGHYDKEDGRTFYHETFTEWLEYNPPPRLRPYSDNGETASWRLELTLNGLGESFLALDSHLAADQ